MKIENQKLYDFLRSKLTGTELDQMASKMGITLVKWARLMRGQDEWSASEVGFMANYLSIHWYHDFCKPLGVGGRISLEESNRLSRDHGQVMEPVDVAA